MLPTFRGAWEISDMAEQTTLRGRALYDALMRIKPQDLVETEWAGKAGVNRGFFTNLKTSEIAPRSDTLRKILGYIGRTEADLYGGGNDVSAQVTGEKQDGFTLEDLAAEHGIVFLEELDLALGMGATFLDGTAEVKGLVPFKEEWLRSLFGVSMGHLKVVRGRGDSMQPTIMDGDIVIVDMSQRRIDDQDRIWAIAYGELGMIRRVRVTSRGTWVLAPDNAVLRTEEVGDGEAHIMGRVVWIGRSI